jgi:lipopolysaccharide transport system permease protein
MRGLAHLAATVAEHRRFVFGNALTEMHQRYAGTGIGVLWHLVQPLATVLLFAFIFAGILATRAGGGKHYLVYLMTGILPWLAFGDCLSRCTTALIDNAHYLRKIALPEVLYICRTAVVSGLMMMVSVTLAILSALFHGLTPTLAWLSVPVAAGFFICFAFGLGLILAPVHVFLRDTGQAVGLLLQFWMWFGPVVMTREMMPETLQIAQVINPASYFIDAIRMPLMQGVIAPWTTWVAMLVFIAVAMTLGYGLLRRTRSDIRDTI